MACTPSSLGVEAVRIPRENLSDKLIVSGDTVNGCLGAAVVNPRDGSLSNREQRAPGHIRDLRGRARSALAREFALAARRTNRECVRLLFRARRSRRTCAQHFSLRSTKTVSKWRTVGGGGCVN